ncbi:MAG: helix-turn-helix transcriptional regulator [Acidobacteria bacterium]|nr:helix-turn-helix transcriptional regulator [Acidobacteriota bacterium]
MSKTLGERIREIREAKGLTQREVAARIQIDDYYISRLENNHINPTLATMQKIASALGVEVRDFFPSTREEFRITPPKLDKDLKKVAALWKGLTEEHKQLMLRFIEQTYKLDTQSTRTRVKGT